MTIQPNSLSRRALLRASSLGFGSLALSYLLNATEAQADVPAIAGADLRPKKPHFAARAKSVIMLVQNGGPSQMDLLDPKPDLNKQAGKTFSAETFQQGNVDKLLPSPLPFRRYGHCGTEMAEILPHLGSVADDFCLVRSMYSEHNNHTEALVLFNTGKIFPGRPALGSWISYGLGTENQNLPAYIVLRDPAGYNTSGTLLWQNAWLPAIYRGTEVSTQGSPVLNLRPPTAIPDQIQRDNLEFLAKLNEEHRRSYPDDSNLDARIRNYELAARMQLAAGGLLDLSRETESTRKLYGLDRPETSGYGLRCLMARRLVESGVRFVQIHPPPFQPWDAHNNVKTENEKICGQTDQSSAALITDLKQRGLLESTIVLWSGEFGRLPITQNGSGRDHNRNAFSLILAGGGFKAGQTYGATDEVGYRAVENRIGVPDLHATVLHQLGLDHTQLTFPHHGSDETLTDSRVTQARVVSDLFA